MTEPFLMLGNSDGCFRILLSKIAYCTSYNSSTVFHIIDDHKPIVVSKPIFYYENILSSHGFVRIHYSTLLNINYMSHTCKGEDINDIILTTGEKLLISRPRRAAVMSMLKQFSVEQDSQQKVQGSAPKKQQSHKKGTAKAI